MLNIYASLMQALDRGEWSARGHYVTGERAPYIH
jgi:hypothetical protein